MSLTWTIDLKVIPLCVNKKGKVTVKVHLSLTDYPKVTQETGMFYTEQDTWSTISDLVGCSTPNCAFLVPVSTKIYFNADLQNFRIRRPRTDAVFLFIFPDGLKHLEEMKFNKCIYIEDACLERLSSIENLQESLYMMEVVSCGNVTDKGLIALHRLKWVCVLLYLFLRIHFPDECFLMSYLIWIPRRNLEYLFLSDLPGITDKQKTVERLQTALPRLEVELDLEWPRTTSCLRLENMDIFFTGFQSKRPRLGVNYSLFILPLGKDPEVSKWLQWLELFASLNA